MIQTYNAEARIIMETVENQDEDKTKFRNNPNKSFIQLLDGLVHGFSSVIHL